MSLQCDNVKRHWTFMHANILTIFDSTCESAFSAEHAHIRYLSINQWDHGLNLFTQIVSKQIHSNEQENNKINDANMIKYETNSDSAWKQL